MDDGQRMPLFWTAVAPCFSPSFSSDLCQNKTLTKKGVMVIGQGEKQEGMTTAL
jgi:hypothetical protein